MAHITGGGITENIIRVIPDGLGLDIQASAIVLPPVFEWLQVVGAGGWRQRGQAKRGQDQGRDGQRGFQWGLLQTGFLNRRGAAGRWNLIAAA